MIVDQNITPFRATKIQHFIRSNSGHDERKDDHLPQVGRLYIFFS